MRLQEHPTVKWFNQQGHTQRAPEKADKLEAAWLRQLCVQAGADDVGFVEIHRPDVDDQRDEILEAFPETRAVACLAFALHREDLRTVCHSVTNLEFRHCWDHANRTARTIVRDLGEKGIRALNIPAGFPFEMDRWPEKMWLTCDKIIAEQAGLGRMGWSRLLLHPKLGSTVILGTILLADELTEYNEPLSYNPCIECKLCVSVCPVGAIAADGHFDFVSCYTHNYRERLGGFADWVERVVASRNVRAYRKKVSDHETISMWQNLSMGAQTRCDKCMGVCPAGEDGIGEFLADRKAYTETRMRRLRDKAETVYVVPGSDAEAYTTARFPHKTVKRVSNGVRPNSAKMFLEALPLIFQRNRSEGLNATFHFTFTGAETCEGTVTIRDKTLEVQDGLIGTADLHATADTATWLSFLAKETNLLWALVTRRIKIKGSPGLIKAFAQCFPS